MPTKHLMSDKALNDLFAQNISMSVIKKERANKLNDRKIFRPV